MNQQHMETESAQVFDAIAPGWYNRFHYTRFKPELENLIQRWQHGKLLNSGCGHGAEFLPFKQHFELYGIDISRGMIKQAERYSQKFGFTADLIQGDIRQMPYPDNSFDWVVSAATYHHLKNRAEITSAMGELLRVLKPGGEAFVTLWNRWQPRFWLKPKRLYLPWKTSSGKVWRFYYLATYPEARRMAKAAGFEIVSCQPENSYHGVFRYFSRNICLVLRKPAGSS